jgi:hypothetical protein
VHTCIKVDYEIKKRNNLGGIIDLREFTYSPRNKDSSIHDEPKDENRVENDVKGK